MKNMYKDDIHKNDILKLPLKYENSTDYKWRPIIITNIKMKNNGIELKYMPITSQEPHSIMQKRGRSKINYWQEIGMDKASDIKVGEEQPMNFDDLPEIVETYGHLSDAPDFSTNGDEKSDITRYIETKKKLDHDYEQALQNNPHLAEQLQQSFSTYDPNRQGSKLDTRHLHHESNDLEP